MQRSGSCGTLVVEVLLPLPNAMHVHLLVNHVPVLGTAFVLLLGLSGFAYVRSRELRAL